MVQYQVEGDLGGEPLAVGLGPAGFRSAITARVETIDLDLDETPMLGGSFSMLSSSRLDVLSDPVEGPPGREPRRRLQLRDPHDGPDDDWPKVIVAHMPTGGARWRSARGSLASCR